MGTKAAKPTNIECKTAPVMQMLMSAAMKAQHSPLSILSHLSRQPLPWQDRWAEKAPLSREALNLTSEVSENPLKDVQSHSKNAQSTEFF